jgi:Flp pilus assembly pilin Flp
MVKELALRALMAIKGLEARFTDEEGQTLAEYGLIMAVIAVAVVVLAGVAFREAIVGAFSSATECLEGAGGCDTGGEAPPEG